MRILATKDRQAATKDFSAYNYIPTLKSVF